MEKDKVSLATLALAKAYTDEHGGGGGGSSNYNDLTHLPTVNGVEFKGTMTGSDLGLVDAETGKGLSANDYTDADKSIVGGVTSALAGKVDKVSGKGLSTNDYSDADKTIVDGVTSALESKTDLDVIADEFSPSTSYAKGTLVVYNGELYKFKKAHSAGAWTGTDVTKRTVNSAKADYFTLSGKLEWDEDMVTHEKILHGSFTPTVTANNENPVTSKGVYTAIEKKPNIFTGTTAEWNALTTAQKTSYEICNLTDDIATDMFYTKAESDARYLSSQYMEQTVTLSTSATTPVVFSNSSITSNSVIEYGCSIWGLYPDNIVSDGTNHICTVTMPKVDSASTVTIRIYLR